ncbi:hypothetical protein CHCC20339_3525 [Bacillus licheniformis]|nr:hypothetical protein CHCC20339_3525 [Bacillus licheniformis]
MCLKVLKQKLLWIMTASIQKYRFVLNAGVMRHFIKKFKLK